MYELKQVAENSYYINCPAKIGIFRQNDTDVYLIDSGNDKNAGKKVRKLLEAHHWNLKGIINTHSNADHIGGNQYLQQQTGCKIFSNGIETAFTKYPILEPSFLYGGYPCNDLRHKFLLASESDVIDISDCQFPKELEALPLRGHFFDMIGIRTPDNVVFLADCISSQSTLEKYQISFIYDVAEYLNTLDKVETMNAKVFVPAHAEATDNVEQLAQLNRQKVFDVADTIQSILKTPMCFERLLKQIFDTYELTMNFEQYVLIGSTIRSYLSWLKDNEKIKAAFQDNLLLWSCS
ncbi:MAG: MBL fold metallo-hydrolase [Lachnospiraceae bacterium]|nr:MBL fold metallo-hydrolase [Lachnospiraceae bacterium]